MFSSLLIYKVLIQSNIIHANYLHFTLFFPTTFFNLLLSIFSIFSRLQQIYSPKNSGNHKLNSFLTSWVSWIFTLTWGRGLKIKQMRQLHQPNQQSQTRLICKIKCKKEGNGYGDKCRLNKFSCLDNFDTYISLVGRIKIWFAVVLG